MFINVATVPITKNKLKGNKELAEAKKKKNYIIK